MYSSQIFWTVSLHKSSPVLQSFQGYSLQVFFKYFTATITCLLPSGPFIMIYYHNTSSCLWEELHVKLIHSALPNLHLLIESPPRKHQNNAWNLFKVKNKDTRTKSLASFWCLYCKLWTYFTPFSSVYIVAHFDHTFDCGGKDLLFSVLFLKNYIIFNKGEC